MDTLDDSENAKISDSAYSNSCSNSQSRRSHSSKSTHSGSNSDGSSGYGGKPSTSGYSSKTNLPTEKRLKDKENKEKKSPQIQMQTTEVQNVIVCRPPEPEKKFDNPKEDQNDVSRALTPASSQGEKGTESMDIATSDKTSFKVECLLPNSSETARPILVKFCAHIGLVRESTGSGHTPLVTTLNIVNSRPASVLSPDSFSCVISMHDGVVMYTTSSITTALGFPKEMWIGRSFLDFVHPRDRNIFASQITTGLAVPKNVNGMITQAPAQLNTTSAMVCRLRRYRGLTTGFAVKERNVSFVPFLLKLSFKNIFDEDGEAIYLIIQATPFHSAFKVPNEVVENAVPFVIRHAANGCFEYIDPESVPYLGFLPQDLVDKDALQLYHPQDLDYLQHVYETIVREGGVSRSNEYRMKTQNGDYVKLETEWSSFINPWSRKLEFVIGKHHIIEGPRNPDVFQTPEPENKYKANDEGRIRAQAKRENIVRIMNEVLTKPAEAAKQQMSKRCQDLAVYMESLMEKAPKKDDDLHLEIQDADHYERDSVMLGGISPHHDCNDSKFSTETPISYNQLNYNETLQRYFDSHQPYSFEECNSGENMLEIKDPKTIGNSMSHNSGDSGDLGSSDSDARAVASTSKSASLDYTPVRLTEAFLEKHNAEMEKELVKLHREQRSSIKRERQKTSVETRQKRKEHLARCNASYTPTTAGQFSSGHQPHGTKRASKHDTETISHKHHCSSQRNSRRWQPPNSTTPPPLPSLHNNNIVGTTWPQSTVTDMNTFFVGVGIPQQMSIVSPVAAMPGMFPMYYAPVTSTMVNNSQSNIANHRNSNPQFQQSPMQCVMYGQALYGSPFMYSPITPQVSYAMPPNFMPPSQQYSKTMQQVGLTQSNSEEGCKPSSSMKLVPLSGSPWHDNKNGDTQGPSPKTDQRTGSNCPADLSNRESETQSDNHSAKRKLEMSSDIVSADSYSPKSTEAVANTPKSTKQLVRREHNEEVVDKTDGESSYSSFYSSFFKTDSDSAEESDAKKNGSKDESKGHESMSLTSSAEAKPGFRKPLKNVAKRKTVPPWMEQVCVTSELVYRYQVLSRSVEEVLSNDKQRMETMEQPTLVNEQLEQLYLDLQLEGVAARLTLEEGITSSSSSGEETNCKSPKEKYSSHRKRREYSKLVMIYEEDAPLPPPLDEVASSSTS